MKFLQCLLFSVLWLAGTAQAQTHYEQLDVGAVVHGGIGLGVFSKPFPMPPGQWTVVARNIKEIPLINSRTREASGSISKYDLTLKNGEPGSMLPLMVFTVTGRLTNLDAGLKPCNPSTNKNQWVDTFPERYPAEVASSDAFVCATSVGISNFKKFVADAAVHNNPWVKSTLSPISSEAYTLPDNAVLVSVSASRYKGYNIDVAFFVKQEGNLTDPAYASHLKPWVHATGLSVVAVVANNATTFSLPTPFPGAVKGSVTAVIDNSVQSTAADATPVADIQIRKKFDLLEVRPDNLRATLLNCIPQMASNINTIEAPPPSVISAVYKTTGSSRIFILKKTQGLCLQTSASNFPIFAAEAFQGTVKPVGVSDEVVADWFTQLAGLVARQGSANVAYQYNNQNAVAVRYWVDASAPLVIRYTTQFKRNGDWDMANFDAVFADPAMTSVASTNLNAQGEGKKDLPF